MFIGIRCTKEHLEQHFSVWSLSFQKIFECRSRSTLHSFLASIAEHITVFKIDLSSIPRIAVEFRVLQTPSIETPYLLPVCLIRLEDHVLLFGPITHLRHKNFSNVAYKYLFFSPDSSSDVITIFLLNLFSSNAGSLAFQMLFKNH